MLSNISILIITHEGHSRNASCALNLYLRFYSKLYANIYSVRNNISQNLTSITEMEHDLHTVAIQLFVFYQPRTVVLLSQLVNQYLQYESCYIKSVISYLNKRLRIPKGKWKMDNPGKLATLGTQDEEKQNKNTIQYALDATTRNQTQ